MGCEKTELSLLLTDDLAIQELNRAWRNVNRPTNVLAFPQHPKPAPQSAPLPPLPCPLLGDVVISVQTARREAEEQGLAVERHLNRLLIHGILHLLGHDHTTGGNQARKMRRLENRLAALIEQPSPPKKKTLNPAP